MKFKLEITMDNAAFSGDGDSQDNGTETARILSRLSKEIEGYYLSKASSGVLRDINGNSCGSWKIV